MSGAKRLIGAVAITALAVVALAACGGSASKSSGHASNELRIGMSYTAAQWDPSKSTVIQSDQNYLMNVYDRLILLNSDNSLSPMLALTWKASSDQKSYVLTLRRGVAFQDGSQFNAQVAADNLNRARSLQSTVRRQLASITHVTAVDDYTIRIDLDQPDPLVLYGLAASAGMQISPKGLKNPASLAQHPAGSGRYILESATTDTVTFTRYDNYWDKSLIVPAKEVITRFTDEQTRLNAFRTGQVDMIQPSVSVYPDLKKIVDAGQGKLATYRSMVGWTLFLNPSVKPLNDPDVRHAISMAIDRDGISKTLLNGQCDPSTQFIGKGFDGHIDSLDGQNPYNPAEAKKIIQSKGITGATVSGIVVTADPRPALAAAVQDEVKKVGLNLVFTTIDNALGTPTWSAGKKAAWVHSLLTTIPDPLSIFSDPTYVPGSSLDQVDPTLANLVSAAQPLPIGSPTRTTALQNINKYLVNNPINIPICNSYNLFLYANDVVGADKMPWSNLAIIADFRGVHFSK